MARIFSELYRKFALVGGALGLMLVTTGAAYEGADWGEAWMPRQIYRSTELSPLVQSCDDTSGARLSSLNFNSNGQCELPPRADRGLHEREKPENIF